MLWVYALLEGGDETGRGLAGEPVRLLRISGLSVAAGSLRAAPAPETAALLAHDGVVRRLGRRAAAILPARFGTIFGDRAALAAAIAPPRGPLRAQLARVRGCEQMTLRLRGRPRARARVRAKSGTAFLADRARQTSLASLPALSSLGRLLAPLVRAERVEHRAPAPFAATVYHLVPRGTAARYRRAVAASRAPVVIGGPHPPYAFAGDVA